MEGCSFGCVSGSLSQFSSTRSTKGNGSELRQDILIRSDRTVVTHVIENIRNTRYSEIIIWNPVFKFLNECWFQVARFRRSKGISNIDHLAGNKMKQASRKSGNKRCPTGGGIWWTGRGWQWRGNVAGGGSERPNVTQLKTTWARNSTKHCPRCHHTLYSTGLKTLLNTKI